jgi:hypothetical protein
MAPKKKAPPEDVDHSEFESAQAIGANTPKGNGAPPTGPVWESVKRLKVGNPRSQALMLKGYTHICVHPLDPDEDTGAPRFCHEPLVCSRPSGTWIQTIAQRHLESEHSDAKASIQASKRKEEGRQRRLLEQLAVENPITKPAATNLSHFKMTLEQEQLTSQAQWFIYAKMKISKEAFEDDYWKNMMIKNGAKVLITRTQLEKAIQAEYDVFILFLKFVLHQKVRQAKGNAFAQFLHDGGTLASHKKYQAFAVQLILPDWNRNFVICFDFPRSSENKDLDVATLARQSFGELTGLHFDAVFASGIQDAAARGVSKHLELEDEVCGMHSGDKLLRSATGDLTRSKNRVVVNPFEDCVKMMANARKMATDFTWDGHSEALWALGKEHAGAENVPQIRLKVDLNGTRVASQHGLLVSEIRLHHALAHWHETKSLIAKPLVWNSSPLIWQQMVEVEAIGNVTKITTTMSQYETRFTGAFGGLIKGTTMAGLRKETLFVVDLANVTAKPQLPRVEVNVTDLSALGATCRERAILEGERRWCGNTGETLTGADVIITDRELMSSLLDLRTIRCPHLSTEKKVEAKRLLSEAYVTFAMTAAKFDSDASLAAEKKAEAEAAAAMKEAAEKKGKAASPSTSESKEIKPIISSGASYSAVNPWAVEGEEMSGEEAEPSEEISPEEGYKSEFEKVWKAWSTLEVPWESYYPDITKVHGPSSEYDLVYDMMPLNMSTLYKIIHASDPERKVYGYLPLMASCSKGQIGALNAESFCERVISAANLVVNEGSTLLSDKHVTMLTVLRMSRDFMEYMRANYNSESRQSFTKSVVDPNTA